MLTLAGLQVKTEKPKAKTSRAPCIRLQQDANQQQDFASASSDREGKDLTLL